MNSFNSATLLVLCFAMPCAVQAFWKPKFVGCCGRLKGRVDQIAEDVEELEGCQGEVTGLQTRLSAVENRTEEQQATLDTLTSQCDCQSLQNQITALNESLVALQAVVDTLNGGNGPTPSNGSLRLINNVNEMMNQGRLEIFFFGAWGTICEDFWSRADAEVACRQLGLPSGDPEAQAGDESLFGQGTGPIWLDNILCTGSEARLEDCPLQNGMVVGENNCDHSEDVGLICKD